MVSSTPLRVPRIDRVAFGYRRAITNVGQAIVVPSICINRITSGRRSVLLLTHPVRARMEQARQWTQREQAKSEAG
jgi:hypothetical protein